MKAIIAKNHTTHWLRKNGYGHFTPTVSRRKRSLVFKRNWYPRMIGSQAWLVLQGEDMRPQGFRHEPKSLPPHERDVLRRNQIYEVMLKHATVPEEVGYGLLKCFCCHEMMNQFHNAHMRELGHNSHSYTGGAAECGCFQDRFCKQCDGCTRHCKCLVSLDESPRYESRLY